MSGKDTQSKTTVKPIIQAKTEEKPKKEAQNKPDPNLRIDKIYRRNRIKDGKTSQAISWITEDGIHHGFQEDIKKNDDGMIVRREAIFGIDYDEKLARELISIAEKTNPEPKLYFKTGGHTFRVTEVENFTGDFKELCKQAMKEEII